jgi:hypothetical protein
MGNRRIVRNWMYSSLVRKVRETVTKKMRAPTKAEPKRTIPVEVRVRNLQHIVVKETLCLKNRRR